MYVVSSQHETQTQAHRGSNKGRAGDIKEAQKEAC